MLSKVKQGNNMYSWVTHTWSVLIGQCPHDCSYCYVKTGYMRNASEEKRALYKGPPRINPRDKDLNLGEGKTIFVAHTADLFADGVPVDVIQEILRMCKKHPLNIYVFQTKNPGGYYDFLNDVTGLPHTRLSVLGTTIESDDAELLKKYSTAPSPESRAMFMRSLKTGWGFKTFITIEPIMKFSDGFADMICLANPDFVNIGADSKHCKLPEPGKAEVANLISDLQDRGVKVRIKDNLERLR